MPQSREASSSGDLSIFPFAEKSSLLSRTNSNYGLGSEKLPSNLKNKDWRCLTSSTDIVSLVYNVLRKTLFMKINDGNTLFTNYNIHDKVCFLFSNTDSHINRLTANFVFQAFERPKKHNYFYHSIISSFP